MALCGPGLCRLLRRPRLFYFDAAEAGSATTGSGDSAGGERAGAIVDSVGVIGEVAAGADRAAGALSTAAVWLVLGMGSSGTISKATMLMILINGLTAGPAVSL